MLLRSLKIDREQTIGVLSLMDVLFLSTDRSIKTLRNLKTYFNPSQSVIRINFFIFKFSKIRTVILFIVILFFSYLWGYNRKCGEFYLNFATSSDLFFSRILIGQNGRVKSGQNNRPIQVICVCLTEIEKYCF